MSKWITSPLALAALLALAPSARAAAAPGNGIRLGGSEGRLHPFLELEGRYDSNAYYTEEQRSVADFVLHVRPGLELTVPGDRLALDFSGSVDRAQYLGMDAEETTDLSRVYGEAGLALAVNRRGAVGLELEDDFRRSPNTSAFVFGGAVVSNLNELRVRVPWRPGGGALTVALTGGWTLETFEAFFDDPLCAPDAGPVCDSSLLEDLGYDELRGGAEVRWRFLPRTSAVFEAGWFSRQPHEVALADEVSGLEVQAGVTGLVTPHVGGTVKLGYADTLGSLDEDVSSLLATVELEWTPTASASVRAGYGRALGVDPGRGLSVYSADRVTAGALLVLARRLSARAEVSWEHRSYELASATADLLAVEPSLEAIVAPWFTASLGYAYTDRSSSFPAGTPAAPGLEYAKSEAWLRLAFRY